MADDKAKNFIENSAPVDAGAYATNYGAHKEGMTKEDVAKYYSEWAEKGTYETVCFIFMLYRDISFVFFTNSI